MTVTAANTNSQSVSEIYAEALRSKNFVELKLASGMTVPDRLKDLADVQELIKIRALPAEFAERLDPYVREKFLELCDTVKQRPND